MSRVSNRVARDVGRHGHHALLKPGFKSSGSKASGCDSEQNAAIQTANTSLFQTIVLTGDTGTAKGLSSLPKP
jgi:hypothetical protein